ncbi:hypothetical protein JCM10207_004135 [Rhodosporidiobolus poonsookiae]
MTPSKSAWSRLSTNLRDELALVPDDAWKSALFHWADTHRTEAYDRRIAILGFINRVKARATEGHAPQPPVQELPDCLASLPVQSNPRKEAFQYSTLKNKVTTMNGDQQFKQILRDHVQSQYQRLLSPQQQHFASQWIRDNKECPVAENNKNDLPMADLFDFDGHQHAAGPSSSSNSYRELGHGHNYRQITRRAAYHYGITKEAWEAGRAW